MQKNSILLGDCEEILSQSPNSIIDLTVTSPPYYNAKDYVNYKSYSEYLDKMQNVFKQVHRVTKEGRFLAINISPVIEPRANRNSMSKRYAIPFDLHYRLQHVGWDFMEDIIWQKPEQCAKNRNGNFFRIRQPLTYKPNVVTEYVLIYRKSTNKLIDWNLKQYSHEQVAKSKIMGEYERTNVWNITPSKSNSHPAIFPEKLVENIINYYSFVGDTILDCFAGIGTTGVVANKMNRDFVLCEQNENYYNHIKHNLNTNEILR